MGLGESSWEETLYGWLTGSVAGIGSKNSNVNMGMLFIGYASKAESWQRRMQCDNTAHTIYQKFGMMHFTSWPGQCLLAEMSKDVPQPIIAKIRCLQGFTVTYI